MAGQIFILLLVLVQICHAAPTSLHRVVRQNDYGYPQQPFHAQTPHPPFRGYGPYNEQYGRQRPIWDPRFYNPPQWVGGQLVYGNRYNQWNGNYRQPQYRGNNNARLPPNRVYSPGGCQHTAHFGNNPRGNPPNTGRLPLPPNRGPISPFRTQNANNPFPPIHQTIPVAIGGARSHNAPHISISGTPNTGLNQNAITKTETSDTNVQFGQISSTSTSSPLPHPTLAPVSETHDPSGMLTTNTGGVVIQGKAELASNDADDGQPETPQFLAPESTNELVPDVPVNKEMGTGVTTTSVTNTAFQAEIEERTHQPSFEQTDNSTKAGVDAKEIKKVISSDTDSTPTEEEFTTSTDKAESTSSTEVGILAETIDTGIITPISTTSDEPLQESTSTSESFSTSETTTAVDGQDGQDLDEHSETAGRFDHPSTTGVPVGETTEGTTVADESPSIDVTTASTASEAEPIETTVSTTGEDSDGTDTESEDTDTPSTSTYETTQLNTTETDFTESTFTTAEESEDTTTDLEETSSTDLTTQSTTTETGLTESTTSTIAEAEGKDDTTTESEETTPYTDSTTESTIVETNLTQSTPSPTALGHEGITDEVKWSDTDEETIDINTQRDGLMIAQKLTATTTTEVAKAE